MIRPDRAARPASALAVLAVFAAAFSPLRAAPPPGPVRGAGRAHAVTGSYERRFRGRYSGNLEVLELLGGRIKFQLVAYGQVLNPGGPTIGDVNAVVALRQGKAIYQSSEGRLALRFQGGRVIISEYGEMHLALGVTAAGTYVWHSRKPEFDKAFGDNP